MGLGSFISTWQRQTKDFGHGQSTNRDQSEKYSCLVFDNRGMGQSDKPTLRYSTTEMALDSVELIDQIGWKSRRQLHIIGASLGGMIAQELGLMIPERIASLSLLSTAPRLINTIGWIQHIKGRISLFMPKSIDDSIAATKASIFSHSWLDEPDAEGHFPTNGDRFAAQEVLKKSDPNAFTRKGFILQAIAAGWHHKSASQIEHLGNVIGRERIQIVHGDLDRMIAPIHGEMLANELGGEERGVTVIRVEGRGHGLPMEWRKGLTKSIASFVEKTDRLKM